MRKKIYMSPKIGQVCLVTEQLMYIASPGVGGGYDPGKPIESKGSDFFDDEEDEKTDQPVGFSAWED